jgi:hypothetical protein
MLQQSEQHTGNRWYSFVGGLLAHYGDQFACPLNPVTSDSSIVCMLIATLFGRAEPEA